ncbi:carbon-nitrogen hydrolase family protein [Flavobacterium sp. HSC-61S13]|uniref:carbon-nitrogen hydrolase family protein n=1 Tax=Flavobacterium sp. HSC-61S13 TaxID=2910963 RepID=UPI0020A1322F|nr:carbon-nitrogen hydrolase family protein [Flavobacterium sp. HSC-61S13]MCP1996480.1 putative amidohydrolase [Flavobacterium sp. HSC-61S13]
MRVGFFQYDVISRDRAANLSYISSKLKEEKFDLIVLPELFTSGYAFDDKEDLLPFVEDLAISETIAVLKDLAADCGGCITGSIPEGFNGLIYNTAILVDRSGLIGFQRKIHLPDYEKRLYTSGDTIQAIPNQKCTIGMMVCFDCWFPAISTKLKLQGAEIVCHSACFGGDVTPRILPIRALENQYFIISCNRVGAELFDGVLEYYRGESQIVDTDGNIVYKAGNQEELYFVNIDLSTVDKPKFGSLITDDFLTEHQRYTIELTSKSQ